MSVLLFALSVSAEEEAGKKAEGYSYKTPSETALTAKDDGPTAVDPSENRLYFQGPDYTVNLIPVAIVLKIILVLGKMTPLMEA